MAPYNNDNVRRLKRTLFNVEITMIVGNSIERLRDFLVTFTALFACVTSLVSAREPPLSIRNTDQALEVEVTAKFKEIESQWATAVATNDPKQIGKFFTEDFLFVGAGGVLQNRQEHLDDFQSGKLKVDSVQIDDFKANVYDEFAVVNTLVSVKGKLGDRDISGAYRFMDTFRLQGNQWLSVARQQTRVAVSSLTTPVEFTIDSENYKFTFDGKNNPPIKVKEGSLVMISLTSRQGSHDWVLTNAQGTRVAWTGRVSAGQPAVTVEFTANEVGTFAYYCSVGNHRAQGMEGVFIVESAPTEGEHSRSQPNLLQQEYREAVQRYLLQEEQSKTEIDARDRFKGDDSRLSPPESSHPIPLLDGGASTSDRPGEVHLTVEYATVRIGNDDVRLRTYNGKLVGPTIRAKAGETIYITLRNKLPEESVIGHGENTHHMWNTTNLHFHGLHVAPQGPEGVPDEESDNVFVELKPVSDPQGSVQKYAVQIPEEHVAGTFWYHAHRHGATAGQVASGMCGALIIERVDPTHNLDSVAEVAAAGEEIMVLQQIPYLKPTGTAVGFVERSSDPNTLTNDWAAQMLSPGRWHGSGTNLGLRRYITVNGKLFPEITLQSGQVRRLRLIHSGQREEIHLAIERAPGDSGSGESLLKFHEIAADGLPLGNVRRHDSLKLYPGYRSDVLIQANRNTTGEFWLVDRNARNTTGADGSLEPLKLIAKIRIAGSAVGMNLPSDAQVQPHRLPDILASDVSRTRYAFYGIVLNPLRFFVSRDDLSAGEVPTGSEFSPGNVRTLDLGQTERWIVGTRNGGSISQFHPFHIHTNPFLVEKVLSPTGQTVTDVEIGGATWRDTLVMKQDYTYHLLTKYNRFAGDFVNHCHILDHEDNGMMERISIRDPSVSPPVPTPLTQLRESSRQDARGKPSVMFFVKGSFCPHCMEQLTKMASSLTNSDAEVTVVTASTEEDLKAFPKVPFRIVADPEFKLFKQHGTFDGEAKHATIVRDRTGKEVLRKVGDEPFMDAKAVVVAMGELFAAREDDAAATIRETTVSQIVDARVYNSQRWPRNLASVVKGQPTLLVFYRNWEECQPQLEVLARHLTQLQALRMRIITVGAINSDTLKAQLEAHPPLSQLPIAFFADAELLSFRANDCVQDDSPLNGTLLVDSDGSIRWSEISEVPFSDGEEILRQATDKLSSVEIEIRSPTGGDDYLTWAAAQARIRLRTPRGLTAPQTVILKNRNPSTAGSLPKRGLVRFSGTLHPGETATQRELTLVLPLDGSWVNFHVAGDSQFPSSRDKDCHIDVVAADSGQLLAVQPLMVRVRKDARGLSAEEWTEFLDAISTLHKIRKEYESFVEIHDLAAKNKLHPDPMIRYTDQAHGNPGFLPWHRVYLLQFERKLQESHPHVVLPFWRQDQTANFFDLAHMGTNRQVSGSGFQLRTRFDVTNPLNLWYIEYDDQQFLLRSARDQTLLPTNSAGRPLQTESQVTAIPGYLQFRRGVEQDPHNQGHNWVGEWMQNCRTSPTDPLFWVFHCEYDRLWAKWQYTRNRFVATGNDPSANASYEPTTAYQPTSPIPLGHHRQDKMWPWDGTQGNSATGEMRSRRPPKAFGPFAASVISGVWPDGTTAQPTPGDAIDYLGLNAGKQEWGFCYEEIPFGAAPSFDFGPIQLAERTVNQHNLALRVITDANGPDELRATAINQLDVTSLNSANVKELLGIASQEKSSPSLRSQILSALSQIAPDEAAQVDLRTAVDVQADTTVRQAAIARLGLGVSFGNVSPESADEIMSTLERLFEDPEPTVAEAALQASIHHASEHTNGAVGWLIQRLSSKDRLPFPRPNAVSIIAAHGTKTQRSQLRPFLDSKDANIREAALTGLASDVESTKRRVEIALMDQVDSVREAALLSLLPDTPVAVETAEKLLSDPKSPLELKALAVAVLREAIDRAPQQVNSQQLKRLLELLEREPREAKANTPLQRSIQHHLPRLKEAFATPTRR